MEIKAVEIVGFEKNKAKTKWCKECHRPKKWNQSSPIDKEVGKPTLHQFVCEGCGKTIRY